MSPFDIVVIGVSLIIVVAVGLLASRKERKTAKDYFLASGRMPWWVIATGLTATSLSSEQIVGTVGAAYKNGMAVANWEWLGFPVYIFMLVFFIPVYLKNRIATVPELLSRRFGPRCGDIYSWAMLFAYPIIFLVTVLYSGSLAFSELTGWNFYVILWGMVILVGIYTVHGGLPAVMWTDTVQYVMLMGGGLVLYFVALDKIPGGWQAMVAAHPERFHLYRPMNDPIAPFLGMITASLGVFLFYNAANQVMIQRVLAARSPWDAMMGIVFNGYIEFFRPLVTCFLGFIVYHWIHVMKRTPPLANPDSTFSFALQTFAPGWGVRGIILAGFLAAVMSTISALANSTATIFALDVYKKLFKPQAGDRELVTAGRVASFLSLTVAALIAPIVGRLGGIFVYFQTGITYLATPFISVILLGILWKRTNTQGALFGLVGGIIIQGVVALAAAASGLDMHWLYLGFIAQVIIMAGIVLVSLKTPPPPLAMWGPFLWRKDLLTDYKEGVAIPWYKNPIFWFVIQIIVSIYLYWRFW